MTKRTPQELQEALKQRQQALRETNHLANLLTRQIEKLALELEQAARAS